MFANLLNNAAKYTPTGGHITLSSAVDGGDAVVKIRDDGAGMSGDLLARAFDLFAQETRAFDRAQGGLGIGLTLVRTLVKMHGGSVQAFSEGPGRGSELVVRLPLGTAATAPAARAAARRAATAPVLPLRVLVVDDNVDAADAMRHVLRMDGHQVRVAYDGPGALAATAAEVARAGAARHRAAGHGRLRGRGADARGRPERRRAGRRHGLRTGGGSPPFGRRGLHPSPRETRRRRRAPEGRRRGQRSGAGTTRSELISAFRSIQPSLKRKLEWNRAGAPSSA